MVPEMRRKSDVRSLLAGEKESGLDLPIWQKVLEIAKNPELSDEEKIEAIAEAKLQSLIGHEPVTVAVDRHSKLRKENPEPANWLVDVLKEGIVSGGFAAEILGKNTYRFKEHSWDKEYRRTIYASATGPVEEIRLATNEDNPDDFFRSPIARHLALKKQERYDEDHNVWQHNLKTWMRSFPAILLNIDDVPKAEKKRRKVQFSDYDEHHQLQDEFEIRRLRLGPEYFRAIILPHELVRNMWKWRTEGDLTHNRYKFDQFEKMVERCFTLQQEIFRDHFELYLPIIATGDTNNYGGRDIICYPPPPGEPRNLHEYLEKLWDTPLFPEKKFDF